MERWLNTEILRNYAVAYGTRLIMALIILVVGLIVAGWLGRSVMNFTRKSNRVDPTLAPLLGKFVRWSEVRRGVGHGGRGLKG